MSVKTIDAKLLSKMFLTGAKNLESKKEYINELNVFPVPDGDTGTNMTLTIMSAAKDVNSLDELSMENLCKAISSGSLRGARGNSGVILSQLLRGFTKVVKEYEEIDVAVISAGFDKAVETAYKAVMKPKEGTILTVAKGAAEKANELFENGEEDLDVFFRGVLDYANEVLLKTPEMLPVLKEAGVVDSGGQGLIEVLQGAYDAFCGKEIEFTMDQATSQKAGETRKLNMEVQADMEIKFGYCTEFIIMLNKTFNVKHEMDFKDYLESIGDSIVVVADDEIVKVHVHTNDPGLAIQRALKYGSLSNMKIDNMRLEHQEKLIKMSEQAGETTKEEPAMEKKEVGFISVSVGDGIGEIFKNLGVDIVIEGSGELGQMGVDLLLSDSTNVERQGYTPSENIVAESLDRQFKNCDQRIIVTTFASNMHRIQAVLATAQRYGRKVAVSGRSMENMLKVAQELGYIKVPSGMIVDLNAIKSLPKNKIVIVSTGSQGENMSALYRMAFSTHKQVDIVAGDRIIISASAIPGNEKAVSKIINELYRKGAEVVSGHACQEELKIIHALCKPRFFIPVHGEQRHLQIHGKLATQMGLPAKNVRIAEIGNVIELSPRTCKINGTVPAGKVFVDGTGVGDVGSAYGAPILDSDQVGGRVGLHHADPAFRAKLVQIVLGYDAFIGISPAFHVDPCGGGKVVRSRHGADGQHCQPSTKLRRAAATVSISSAVR